MPFKEGEQWNGNKDGRPKKDWTWASLIEEEAEKLVDEKKPSKGTVKQAITKALLKKAVIGDVQAYRELANRTDGMPKETKDIKVSLPKPIMDILDVQQDDSDNQDSETQKED